MVKGARQKPERLAEKLKQIRLTLGLSQSQMLRRLGLEESIPYTKLSHYELGHRQPSLMEIMRYADVAGVCTDVLIRDELNLPVKLPSRPEHNAIKRATRKRR
jgi:transcriptional regulator with XRE-family HTH domain